MTMYHRQFATVTSNTVRAYQVRVARALATRKHVLLRAPTGAGKTLAVLVPFLVNQHEIGARRLIYTLPLRTLVQSIHAEAEKYAGKFGKTANIQTAAQPDDPFFDRSDIIVTTYDQLLSGYLCGPYSLSSRLYNINAAAVAGNLVVYDEFHLMDPTRAFLTGIHCAQTFGKSSVSIWMTATATSPLSDYLKSELDVEEISLDESELEVIYQARNIQRTIQKVARPLAATDLVAHPGKRVLAVVNQVARAKKLYCQLSEAGHDAILLHARFFAQDRDRQRIELQNAFGKDATGPAIAIATQVVEAGMDLSADVLLTELCPMNALIQRVGRCARFDNQHGDVRVFQVESRLPYEHQELEVAWSGIIDGADLDPVTANDWVEQAHRDADKHLIQTHQGDMRERTEVICSRVQRGTNTCVSDLIRERTDTVSVIISRDPTNILPKEREMIGVWRSQLNKVTSGWTYDPDAPGLWRRFSDAKEIGFIAALDCSMAHYTAKEGLTLGQPGDQESPKASRPQRSIDFRYRRESWQDHTDRVVSRIKAIADDEILPGGLLDIALGREKIERCGALAARYHDLGKLQVDWDRWAERYQKNRDPSYVHSVPLAHTDYDPRCECDRAALAASGFRPPHAAASAFFAARLLEEASVPECDEVPILCAILAHHGGWYNREREIDKLLSSHASEIPTAHQRQQFGNFIDSLFDEFEDYWPLTAILTRLLRRADQKATEDYQTE